MKEKYIQERFSFYFEFGNHPDGRVDVASCHNDTIATVTKEHALNLIKDRDEILAMLVKVSQKLDELSHEEFSKIWYE